MEDIAPALLETIRAVFLSFLGDDKPTQNTYEAAGDYADRVGAALAQAFAKHLSGTLPDGKMYWNIARRVVGPLLKEDHALCAGAAAGVQKALNEAAGIGLAVQEATPDESRIDGILQGLCAAETYTGAAHLLSAPVLENFSRAAVDETLRRNVEAHARAGLRPRIVRTAENKCCAWCAALAGAYDYPDVPKDVYRRHARCRCVVEYDPATGRRQNVWTKKWTTEEESVILEKRKWMGAEPGTTYTRPGVVRVRNSELPNGLPLRGKPGSIVDKTDGFGKVLQRRIYDGDGLAAVDYDTSDHNLPQAHPTGAHKHVFNHQKRNPHGKPLPLTEEELEVNADIIQHGVNYHDKK